MTDSLTCVLGLATPGGCSHELCGFCTPPVMWGLIACFFMPKACGFVIACLRDHDLQSAPNDFRPITFHESWNAPGECTYTYTEEHEQVYVSIPWAYDCWNAPTWKKFPFDLKRVAQDLHWWSKYSYFYRTTLLSVSGHSIAIGVLSLFVPLKRLSQGLQIGMTLCVILFILATTFTGCRAII